MTTGESPNPGERRPAPSMPEAVVRSRAHPSIVWLIPLIAALVGLFLAYRAYSERGPTISISFERALGIEAGKTKVKFKEVDIGLVEAVEVSNDLTKVIVTASLVSGSERYLTKKTRFWVVRAEVSAGQISGIGTVLSGAYIAIDPSTEGKRTRRFVGLEKAPVVTSAQAGTIFNLRAESLGSVDVGSPVYFRWLRVGQVAGYELAESGDLENVQVFVEAPHDQRVRSTTRFWNASGLQAEVTADGLQLDTPSFLSMLVGGIAFETPPTFEVPEDVPDGMIFDLYPNKRATSQTRYLLKSRYVVKFDQSVAGLAAGSPVEFQGIKIGEVENVELELDPRSQSLEIPVVIEIEPERMGISGQLSEAERFQLLEDLVAKGMRARLTTSSLITGRKAIDFALIEDAEPAEIQIGDQYPELPTAGGSFDAIASRVARIVDRVDRVPIEDIGKNLDRVLVDFQKTLDEVRDLADTTNKNILPTLATSLESLETTLRSADSMISEDSAIPREVERLIIDLAEAARSLRLLAERLEEHPEELLRGRAR